MARSRCIRFKAFWIKYKLFSHLRVLLVLIAIVMFVTPLRNALVPGWPHLLKQLSTWKVIRIHLGDLLLYVDRSPYDGPCGFIHERLANVKMPKLEDMPVYTMEDWKRLSASVQPNLAKEHLAILDNYKPSLTVKEQREMLYVMLSITQALGAFNITYFLAQGSLIGYWRHHGMIPWDDDVDILFDGQKWPLARQVLSCLPDFELKMGSDYMWKVYHKNSDLWTGQTTIKFPYVDLYLYNEDEDHVWPYCIWMKTRILLPREWTLPVTKGVFEGYPVFVPRRSADALNLIFGRVDSDCYSRTFMRRERQLVPFEERTHLPCSALRGIYPFVVRQRVDKEKGTVVEERTVFFDVLSTFNTSYQGTLQ